MERVHSNSCEVKMSKIVALSRYGFKVDSLRNDWEKVDKSLLHRDCFNLLEKGLEIQVTERNKKGFILDFKVLHHKDQGEEVLSNNSSLKSTHTLNSLKSNSLPVSHSFVVGGVDVLEREEVFLNPQNVKPSSVQDSIRYAQCVNIAFDSVVIGGFVSEEAGIVYAFDRADKIYKEFNLRCSR